MTQGGSGPQPWCCSKSATWGHAGEAGEVLGAREEVLLSGGGASVKAGPWRTAFQQGQNPKEVPFQAGGLTSAQMQRHRVVFGGWEVLAAVGVGAGLGSKNRGSSMSHWSLNFAL